MHPVLTFGDIVRFTQRDPKDVKRALAILKQLELVIESGPVVSGHVSPMKISSMNKKWFENAVRISGHMYYRLNEHHPWVPGLKIIFENSSIGIIPLINKELKTIEGIEIAFIFGSLAAGEQNIKSDVDLVVIGHHNPEGFWLKWSTLLRRELVESWITLSILLKIGLRICRITPISQAHS